MAQDRILELISQQLKVPVDKLDDSKKLVEDLGADSLDMVEMLMTCEDEFGISIDDDEAVKIKTIGDIRKLLAK